MFVKITNGQVDKFPYTVGDLRKDNPNISFPRNIDEETMQRFGVYRVTEVPAPDYNQRTQRLVTQSPTLVDSNWTVTRAVVAKDQSQIDAETNEKASNVREERDRLLASTDWRFRSDMSPSQAWVDYCQSLRDIPQQSGFPWNVTWPVKPE
jgi:hypothetical protein